MDCIFCSIASGDIPSEKIYEDDEVLAFKDINPEAPVHILIIPKKHIESCDKICRDNSHIIARIFEIIPKIAETSGLSGGYRIISNVGEDGGQSVKHLHFHILGGTKLPVHIGA